METVQNVSIFEFSSLYNLSYADESGLEIPEVDFTCFREICFLDVKLFFNKSKSQGGEGLPWLVFYFSLEVLWADFKMLKMQSEMSR